MEEGNGESVSPRGSKRKAESPAASAEKRHALSTTESLNLGNEYEGEGEGEGEGDGNGDGYSDSDSDESGEEHPEEDGGYSSQDESLERDEDFEDEVGFSEYSEEGEAPPETEVEEQELSLGTSIPEKATIKLFLQEDAEDEEFSHWMQTIHVRCSLDGKDIGRGFGRFVNRGLIASNFWRDMEEPCRELSSIAFEVFDRYGRLKQEFKDHEVRKGTGSWGDELDTGSLFIIEYVLVDKEWRRKGVGKTMVSALIAKAAEGERRLAFSLVAPGWLGDDISDEIRGKTKRQQRDIRFLAQDNATSFYRSLGFRRIGASSCLGLPANDPNHRIHMIPLDADFEPAEEEPEEEPEDPERDHPEGRDPTVDEVVGSSETMTGTISKRLDMLKNYLPLHNAVTTLSDVDCAKFFQAFKVARTSDGEWTKVDRLRRNILHVVAIELKVESVQWLMRHYHDLLGAGRDFKGYTPLEVLNANLETKRSTLQHGMMTICVSDKFLGYPNEVVKCLTVLHGIDNPTIQQQLRLKYGCTCGECIDGFLSPRMKFALLCQAEVRHDGLNMEIEDGEIWSMTNDYMIENVEKDIQRNFLTNKSLRQGYTNIFDHTATALRSNTPPTIENVLQTWRESGEWPPVTKNFYERGGNAESAIRTIFMFARDQDEWAGDGEHMAIFEDKVNALPQCRNDHEFGFVALACGVENL